MAFNIFATATSSIPLANLDANFTAIGTSSAASTLYPTATTSITYGASGAIHLFDGNVGIGTSSISSNALSKLQIPNGWVSSIGWQSNGTAYTTAANIYNGIYGVAADTIAVATVGSERMRIDSSGNVGIGTSSPAGKLSVLGGSLPASGNALSISNGLGATRLTTDASNGTSFIGNYLDAGALEISQGSSSGYVSGIVISARSATNSTVSDAVALFTRSSERMRIDSSGNVYGTSGTTTMTNGFFYIPSAGGAPSGTPTAVTGRVPMYYDTTNNQFYVYNGAWKKVTLA